MTCKELAHEWFSKWDAGDFERLPLATDFQHTSPYGTISGKNTYLDLVRANTRKFLGNQITIIDDIFLESRGCVRYSLVNTDFSMEVTEWFYTANNLIKQIVAYYHIGDTIVDERKLNLPGHQN